MEVVIQTKCGYTHKTPPIIAISVYAMEGDKERIIGSGCDGYFVRPFDLRI